MWYVSVHDSSYIASHGMQWIFNGQRHRISPLEFIFAWHWFRTGIYGVHLMLHTKRYRNMKQRTCASRDTNTRTPITANRSQCREIFEWIWVRAKCIFLQLWHAATTEACHNWRKIIECTLHTKCGLFVHSYSLLRSDRFECIKSRLKRNSLTLLTESILKFASIIRNHYHSLVESEEYLKEKREICTATIRNR